MLFECARVTRNRIFQMTSCFAVKKKERRREFLAISVHFLIDKSIYTPVDVTVLLVNALRSVYFGGFTLFHGKQLRFSFLRRIIK